MPGVRILRLSRLVGALLLGGSALAACSGDDHEAVGNSGLGADASGDAECDATPPGGDARGVAPPGIGAEASAPGDATLDVGLRDDAIEASTVDAEVDAPVIVLLSDAQSGDASADADAFPGMTPDGSDLDGALESGP